MKTTNTNLGLLFLAILGLSVSNAVTGQTTLFSENFESASEGELSTSAFNGWKQDTELSTVSDWAITNNCPISGSYSMTLHAYGAYCEYAWDDTGEEVAYYATAIDATAYNSVTLSFDWTCRGEVNYDYGRICYSTNGTTWTDFTNSGTYVNQSSTQSVTNLDISEVDGTSFYLGFRWINDSNTGTDPGWNVDNIVVKATANCSVTGGSITAGTDPICNGNSTTLTLSGYTGGSSFQWQSSSDNSSWSNIGGATSSTYTASPSSDTYYRVSVTNGCTAYSSSYLLNVSNAVAGTASASSNSLCSGSSVTMTLSGYSGSIQWQSSTNGSTWSNVGGATSATYSPSPGSDIYYRAKVTDAPCSAVYSNSEFIEIVTCVNMTNGSTTSCSGILYDDGGSSSDYSASTDYTYTINPGATVSITFNSFDVESHASCGYDYLRIYDGPNTSSTLLGTYCNTTGSPGTIVSSGGALTFVWHADGGVQEAGWEAEWSCCSVNPGTASASSTVLCVAGNTTLSLSGQDGGTSIQWQSSSDGSTWSDIGGAVTASEIVAVTTSTYYRAKVTNGCDSYTASVYVVVGGTPVPTNYYVNDNSTSGDVFCSNVGNAANNGRNPCSPKASLQDIFDTYDLEPGDTVFVDAGTYTMGVNITSSSDGGSSAADVVIRGAGTTLTHITAPTNDDNFYIDNVLYITVRDMHLSSSQASNYNYYIFEGNDHHLDNCHLEHSAGTNVYMFESGGTYDIDDNAVSNCEIENTSTSGYNIWIRGDADHDTIRNCVISSTGTSAKAILLNDYYSGSHDGWPTSIHFYGNNVTADDYGIVGDVVDGNTMETYDIHDNVFNITSSNRADGAAIWLDDHGLSSSDISNIYNNIISGGKCGFYLSSGVDYCHFYNNFICNTEYGFYISSDNSDDNDYHYNSIYSSKECFYFTADSKAYGNLRNNILYTTGNSSYACLYAGNTSSTFIACDYNIYYAPNGAYIAKEGSNNYSLAGWQGTDHHDGSGNGDNNSYNTDPNYRNPSSCQLDLTGNYQTGTSVGAIGIDIYGTGRTHPTIGAWEEGSSLPVLSTYAFVECESDQVVIKWNTVSELNNDYFVIEGTNDGQNFSDLSTVMGAGNSTSEIWYDITFNQSEIIYDFIRISQVDYNGDVHVLKFLTVECDEEHLFEINNIYPNPTMGELTLVISSAYVDQVDVEVLDLEGRLIMLKSQEITRGLSFLQLNVADISNGVYVIKVANRNNEISVKRFVKQ